jgi:hypothetical protein
MYIDIVGKDWWQAALEALPKPKMHSKWLQFFLRIWWREGNARLGITMYLNSTRADCGYVMFIYFLFCFYHCTKVGIGNWDFGIE